MRALIFAVVSALVFSGCDNQKSKVEQANRIISAVDAYQKEYKRLPEDLNQVGLDALQDDSVYYQREGEGDYIVWYGLELGESKIFRSKTRVWE